MSVDAYLGINGPCVPDESVEEMVLELTEPRPRRSRVALECGPEVYDSVDAYDPVLLWHCRLVSTASERVDSRKDE